MSRPLSLTALFLLLLALGALRSGAATTAHNSLDALAASAEEAFQNGRYPEAVRKFEQLAAQVPDPAVLYNLGTAQAQAGQKGMAIWRYLQAEELAPRDPDIRNNLRTLAPNLSEQLAIAPVLPIDWLYHHFTGNEWATIAGGASVLAMLLGAFYFWRSRRRGAWRWLTRGVILPLVLVAALAYPFAFTHFYYEDVLWRGVVVAEQTVARAGPSLSQIETDTLPVGTVIRIIPDDVGSGWYKFSYAGGRMGFVESSRVRPL